MTFNLLRLGKYVPLKVEFFIAFFAGPEQQTFIFATESGNKISFAFFFVLRFDRAFFKFIPVLVEYNSIMFLYNPKKRVFIQMCYLMKSPHFVQDCILDVSFINYDVNVIYEL